MPEIRRSSIAMFAAKVAVSNATFEESVLTLATFAT